jgi:NAD(P)-dependent dehydrogenase (short-subunit alcohol dehydrogenase family)
MSDLKRFVGQVALVTGSAHGIGQAIVERFAQEGASVVVSDIDLPGANEVVSGIESRGGSAIAVKCDVKSKEDIAAMIEKTIATYGKIDILVNNAGDVTIAKHFLTN